MTRKTYIKHPYTFVGSGEVFFRDDGDFFSLEGDDFGSRSGERFFPISGDPLTLEGVVGDFDSWLGNRFFIIPGDLVDVEEDEPKEDFFTSTLFSDFERSDLDPVNFEEIRERTEGVFFFTGST